MSPTTRVPRTRFHLNLPVGLHSRLVDRAAVERRSLNSLMVWLLERGLDLEATAGSPMWITNSHPPEER